MPLSFEDFREIARAEMVTRRPDLAAVTGDASDMAASAGAAMADAAVGIAAKGVRDTYLDGASGDALATLVLDRYGLERVAAAQAVGSVSFSRTSGGSAMVVAAGTRVATQPDSAGDFQVYVTTSDAVFPAAGNGPIAATVQAELGGKPGNAQAGTVTRILDALSDATITVTNAVAVIGGAEEEGDDDLRERARAFYKTLRRGTKEALEFGALQVPAVKRATAVEDGISIPVLYVTDADGNSNQAMVDAVELEIEGWRALGACVTVTGGALFEQSVVVSLAVRAGVDAAALVDVVREAISARVARLKIGETLYRSLIVQAARNVDPFNIVNVTVTTPAADIVPSSSQIIRSPESLVTVS